MAILEPAINAVCIGGTIGVWCLAQRVYNRHRSPLCNPVFLSVAGIIAVLLAAGIDYAHQYEKGGQVLEWMLEPTVVAFAVPLYRQRRRVLANAKPIGLAVALGSVVGIVSASGCVLLLGGSPILARTLAPKSVTTPIALRLSEQIDGMDNLTVGIVIVTGILGAMFGPEFLRGIRVRERLSLGLAVGTASHGIGTARMQEEDRAWGDDLGKTGSMIGMILNGIVTAIIINWVVAAMGIGAG
jgi:predicted murein hydrolase (TIGR00659 family)